MILAHADINEPICMKEYQVAEWIIESPELFAQYLGELLNQSSGKEGNFVLSDGNKEILLSKSVEIIVDPLSVNINDKKIISKVYSELLEIANDESMFLRTREVIGILQQYFMDLEYNYGTTLMMDDDIELQGLFKILGIKVESENLTLLEKLTQYIALQRNLLNKKLIIFVNLRSYLTTNQLDDLFEYAKYNEINLLLIESFQRDFTKTTKKYIIDIDQCEI